MQWSLRGAGEAGGEQGPHWTLVCMWLPGRSAKARPGLTVGLSTSGTKALAWTLLGRRPHFLGGTEVIQELAEAHPQAG